MSTASPVWAIAISPSARTCACASSKPSPRKNLAFHLPIGCVSESKYRVNLFRSTWAASALGSLTGYEYTRSCFRVKTAVSSSHSRRGGPRRGGQGGLWPERPRSQEAPLGKAYSSPTSDSPPKSPSPDLHRRVPLTSSPTSTPDRSPAGTERSTPPSAAAPSRPRLSCGRGAYPPLPGGCLPSSAFPLTGASSAL